ncbi:MAG: fimbrillin family protein [Alistipes sp.]|nr:fimbrillin family protein [Alistipes sp.]
MKIVLIAILTVVALASCSNEETILVAKPDAINFGTPFIENSTRAADDDFTSVSAFKVWGNVKGTTTNNTVFLYDGAQVELENGAYVCKDKTEYWVPNAEYKFLAIAGASSVYPESGAFPTTVGYTADGSTDLLISESVSVKTYDDAQPSTGIDTNGNVNPVTFTFSHLLSKVVFSAKGAESDGYTYEVTDIIIKNAKTEGSVAVGTKTWSSVSDDDTEIAGFGSIEGSFNGQYVDCEHARLLIPYIYSEGSEIEISMVVKAYSGGELIQTTEYTGGEGKEPCLKAIVTLEPGYSYNFKFEHSVGKPIEFGVEKLDGFGNSSVTVQ